MITDQEFEREWAQVKAELSKLTGCTVYTISRHEPNFIESVDEEKGLLVVTRDGSEWVGWRRIRRQFEILLRTGRQEYGSGGRGSFCRAAFAILTIAEVHKEDRKTILKYMPDGRPPQVRPREEWPCQDRQA